MTGENINLSAVIIALNEENNIKDCLESVSWADEIVVVDSFSSDETANIVKKYTDRFFQKEFKGHIEQKNYALSLANGKWIVSIDADERISDELKNEIKETINSPSPLSGYFIRRENYYLGKKINHSGWNPDCKIRLFRKDKGKWGGRNPHDSVILNGKAGYLKAPIIHLSYNNLERHFSQIDYFTSIGAEEYFQSGKKCRLYHLLFLPFVTLFKKLILKGAFLDGERGVMISLSTVFSEFLKYAKLWELNEKKGAEEKTHDTSH